MNDIRPFKIDIDQQAIDDLHARLDMTRWPEAECVDDWSQGAPLSYVRELAEYWRDSYDWFARQERMNAYPQFMTEIDGVDIHFIHHRSPHEGARPLILTHGWPGSILEFLKVIGPLTDPTSHGGRVEDAFHVVCPALPGYGFSGKPTTTGWGVGKIAAAWDTLMQRLGYERYFAQGGDWGSAVTTEIGIQNLGRCAGIHVNMMSAGPTQEARDNPTPEDIKAFKALTHYQNWDSGYSWQQKTRPQTVGYALVDSPVGQLAWIVEKFRAWTDCDGRPENALTRDEMLDDVMFYWLTASAASSARLYWESFDSAFAPENHVGTPSGYSMFPEEIFPVPLSWSKSRYPNMVYFNKTDKGGHFAAMEQPEIFVGEVRACFSKMSL